MEICEYGQVHGQCRCPSPSKTKRQVPCTTPDTHATIEGASSAVIGRPDLANRFTYHPPSQERVVKHIMIREHGKALAEYLDENVPDGPEKDIAIRRVEEAIMWANAGLARSPE